MVNYSSLKGMSVILVVLFYYGIANCLEYGVWWLEFWELWSYKEDNSCEWAIKFYN